MTPQQIADDLRPHVRGRLAVDDLTRRLYSTDASPFQIEPAAVFVPLDEEDLVVAVKFAFERGISIVPRGAGTGLAGESLNSGIVIDLSVHFRKVLVIGPDWVRVQPGITLRELNDALASQGQRFAPDPTNSEVATLGGMIATNASGATAFRHGYVRDHVVGLRVIWDDGEAAEIKSEKLKLHSEDEIKREKAVRELFAANAKATGSLRTNARCGYHLAGGLLDLLVGSEGTLAITTEATLRTVQLAGGVGQYALGFASLDAAVAAGLTLRTHEGIAGCDLLDQRLMALARGAKDVLAIPADAAAALMVTFEAASEDAALEMARTSFAGLLDAHPALPLAEPAIDAASRQRIQRFRDAAVLGFYALSGGKRPEAFVEDIGVPPEALPAFLASAQQLLREADLTASFLVHVLTGQVHCRPLVDLSDPADQAKAWPLANQLFELAISLGGTISAQHGVGLARTPWIEKQFGPLAAVFREVKRIFDPKGILNPGKIVGPDPSRPAWPFRNRGKGQGARGKGEDRKRESGIGMQGKREEKTASDSKTEILIATPNSKAETRNPLSLYDEFGFQSEIKKCNSCGDCRVRSAPSRMCPLFRVTGEEAATPRAKANLLAAVLESDSPERLSDDDVKAVARLCVQCNMCRDECRAGIDIPHLMLEAKAAHYAAHGFDRGEWLIARSERLAALGGTFAFTANILLSLRPTRWLLEKIIGLSRRRNLHRFTHRTFLRRRLVQRLFRREVAGATRKFAYFVDTFANYNDPLIAEATVAVLEYHGFAVEVPRRQRGSGMPALSVGEIDKTRSNAAYNVRTFAELVRDGYTVVASEPTAALALKEEYPRLLATDDAKLVAANTVELTALLADLQSKGELKPPTRELPLGVGHHVPCHLKALGTTQAPSLLALIPKLSVQAIDVGCSGSAGAWGFARVNHETSLKIGEPLFAAMDRPRIALGATECSTCRMQIQQGSGKRVLHPVQFLALAYGLVPQLEARLTRPLRPLLTG